MLSFGVLIAFWSPKQSVIEESSLESMAKQWKARNMKNQSFEVLFHKKIQNARRGSEEKSAMKHFRWQSFQPLLEHFLESNLCMLYVASNLRKLTIQCFKWCAIRNWNEGVTAIGSRTPQVERNFAALRNQPFAAKWFHSPFCASVKSRRPRFHLWNGP